MAVYYNTNREWENHLQEARIAKGLTIQELADRSKTSTGALVNLMSGLISPIYQICPNRGKIKPWVERVCMVLSVKPEDMFPREVCPLEDPSIKKLQQDQINDITLSEYGQMNPESLQRRHMKKIIWRLIIREFWFRKDSDHERFPRKYKRMVKVVQWRFLCNMTLEEVALRLNVQRERIRQMEARILRHMRALSFTKTLNL
jgi:transcriptional regulator with XRE-family HTH domain